MKRLYDDNACLNYYGQEICNEFSDLVDEFIKEKLEVADARDFINCLQQFITVNVLIKKL